MIQQVRFRNFKVLKAAELNLAPFNLIIGPNGSGKSTVFEALRAVGSPEGLDFRRTLSLGVTDNPGIAVDVQFADPIEEWDRLVISWRKDVPWSCRTSSSRLPKKMEGVMHLDFLKAARFFTLDAAQIAVPGVVRPKVVLGEHGDDFAVVLEDIRDRNEESFEAIRAQLRRWIPEYDSIGFWTPAVGQRSFRLRRVSDKRWVDAQDLSEGTLLALCLLTVAYDPNPPPLVCIEEPDRGLHPRLLREVLDALTRLSFPEPGENRKPVQVIATTHSPMFLDQFKGRPEHVIIAEKNSDGTASFKNLTGLEGINEILDSAPLGDIWYQGALGGVPVPS